MIKHRPSTWQKNNGNLLMSIAAVACVVVSVIWYLDLLPNIELEPNENGAPPSLVESFRPAAVLVVALHSDDTATCFVEVFRPFGELSPSATPIAFREFPNNSESKVAVFTELRPGEYVVGAYLDLDGNGEINGEDEINSRTFYQPHELSEAPQGWADLSFSINASQAVNIKLKVSN